MKTTRNFERLKNATAMALFGIFLHGCALLEMANNLGDNWDASPTSQFEDWGSSGASNKDSTPTHSASPKRPRNNVDISQYLDSTSGNVALGMNMNEVLERWGEPVDIEIAGNKSLGNQRWIYPDGAYSMATSGRILYFEQGRLAGWETPNSTH